MIGAGAVPIGLARERSRSDWHGSAPDRGDRLQSPPLTMTAADPDTMLAETRKFNAELERLLATMPPVYAVPVEETRRARREGRSIFPRPCSSPRRGMWRSSALGARSRCG